MKNVKNKREKGITLIALVVTIVVLIILATISINAVIGQGGIIEQAKRAKNVHDEGQAEELTKLEEMANGIAKYYTDGSGSIVKASDISSASDKSGFYGKKVNGYTCTNSAGVQDWQIFYADDNNIYLIASNYISSAYCPGSKTKSINVETSNDFDCMLYMEDVVADYEGSASVSTVGRKLNKSYFDYLTANSTASTNNNMKAVAYMTDTDVWKVYAGEKAEYAIGGPTIEMFMKSCSQKYNGDYQAKATNINGYQLSTDGGANWKDDLNEREWLSYDSLYTIASGTRAHGMWVASPSASGANYLIYSHYCSNVYVTDYEDCRLGFRPLVCLQSDVQLVQGADGNFTIKD